MRVCMHAYYYYDCLFYHFCLLIWFQDITLPAMRTQASAVYIGIISIVASIGPVLVRERKEKERDREKEGSTKKWERDSETEGQSGQRVSEAQPVLS